MYFPPHTDVDWYRRVIASPHTSTGRCELWSEGSLVTSAAPYVDGEVKDEWVQAGIRRSLTLSVPSTVTWFNWLRLPKLEIRPFRGVRLSSSESVEFPLGRFLVLTPELMARPAVALALQADDQWSWVVTADFTGLASSASGGVVNAIRLLIEGAGLGPVTVASTSVSVAKSVLFEGTRQDAIASSATAIGVEAYVDRFGTATITDVRALEYPTAYVLAQSGGTAVGLSVKPDWTGVYNTVSVLSSATDVSFPPQVASVTWPQHPAARGKIGERVMHYASPLLRTAEQGMAAAVTILRRVAAPSTLYSYTCVPDASIDAGDSVFGSTLDGSILPFQVQTITHPLNAETASQVTMVSTRLEPGEWQPFYAPPVRVVKHVSALFNGTATFTTHVHEPVTAPFGGMGVLTALIAIPGPSIYPDTGVYPDTGTSSTMGQ